MIMRLFSTMFGSSKALTATNSVTNGKDWSVGQGVAEGNPIVIRIRSALPSKIQAKNYPTMIAISWKYSSPEGMPSPELKERMNQMEDSLSGQLETSGAGVLTAVVTGNDVAEWQFYTRDQDEFMRDLNTAFANKPQFPIDLFVTKDPAWDAYKKFKTSA